MDVHSLPTLPERARAQDPRLAAHWRRALTAIPPGARALFNHAASAAAPLLAEHFYGEMLDDPRAARFLSPEQVRDRLKPSLQRWLLELLRAGPDDVDALAATQETVGLVHARIGIPVDLVGRGARMLKGELQAAIRTAGAVGRADDVIDAIVGVDALIDLALEAMTRAYDISREQAGTIDASYRLFSLIQNVGTERERQRALLLAWENTLLYALSLEQPPAAVPLLLSRSEFGLWFTHKGMASFGETPETRRVAELVEAVDTGLRDGLPHSGDPALRRALVDDTRAVVAEIRNLLTMMFDGIGDLESGRDALTRLLNRRFLPTVLRREIQLQANTGRMFAVLMIDLDHFKAINDGHGHEVGDRALQHVAALLVQNTRGSDYLFRYGGEEFVVVLGSVGAAEALATAEGLRSCVAGAPVALANGESLMVTASIGLALQDGHPDYERILARADAAMYAAKRGGRNRVVVATDDLPDPPGVVQLRQR